MEAEEAKGEPVYLKVYSGGKWNCLLNFFGIGIYHTGVEVYKQEYWYGGHNGDTTGIVRTSPGEVNLKLEESILIGNTMMSHKEVLSEMSYLDRTWTGSEYDPFSRNCNSFSKELIYRLCQSRYFPPYINRFVLLKPLFQIWYAPLRRLCGDLVKLKPQDIIIVVRNDTVYKLQKINSESDFISTKEIADSFYMVNSYKEALAGYEACIAGRRFATPKALQHVYMAAASCCLRQAKHTDMERLMTLCIKDFPAFASGYLRRARAYAAVKRFGDARKDLGRAAELEPENWLVAEEAGRVEAMQRAWGETGASKLAA